jgi:hypothetical protein
MPSRKIGQPNFNQPFEKWRKVEKDEALRLLALEKKRPKSIFEAMASGYTDHIKQSINSHFEKEKAKRGRPTSKYTPEFNLIVLSCIDRGRAELAIQKNLPPEKITVKEIIEALVDQLIEDNPGLSQSRNKEVKRLQNIVGHVKRITKNYRDE